MLPKVGKLRPVSANDKERRTWADLLPAIACRFRVLPKAEIRERCVQALTHDPAISIANFIPPVRICARLSKCSQAIDDEDTRAGDGDYNLSGPLPADVWRGHPDAGIRPTEG